MGIKQNKAKATHIEAGRSRGVDSPRKAWSLVSSGQGGINVSTFSRGSARQLGVFAADSKHMTGYSRIRREQSQFYRPVYRFNPVLLGSVKSKSQDGEITLPNLTDLTDYLSGSTCAHRDASGCARARGGQLDPERLSVKSVKSITKRSQSCGFDFTCCGKTGLNHGSNSVKRFDSSQSPGVIA